MNNIRCTIIHFDYGGYYSKNGDDIRWISRKDEYYTIMMKTSMEEVTYIGLVERICKKMRVDETTTKLKLSYIPLVVDPKRPSYILDDEDVFGYLMDVNKDQCRSVLHVELIKDFEQNQCFEQLSRGDQGSEVGVRNVSRDDRGGEVGVKNKELLSSGRDDARGNDGIITIDTEGEPSKHNELLDNAEIIDGENVSCEELANVDNSGMSKNVELTPDVEGDQYVNHAWEDGIDLTIGQEFESKQAVQDLVDKASCQNRFEVATIKSETKLYVVKCRESKNGCKWSLRVAKLKNSNRFSVRTYNKMHTCSQTTTSTSRNKRKCTPQLVASILHEDYPGQIDTPTPKNLIDMVEERFGVKVSYSTALRGKKKAANDLRGGGVSQ